ncbi:MAG: LLM class flavin-dependent oxidoreductase [Gammaproteobacteria bacterium]|nr:LLM class flavin-dependent oxidoreductase [Gammaproteobacteria bacterium]
MKIGMWVKSAYQTDNVRDGVQQMIARTQAAAKAGLESLFVGDHHIAPPHLKDAPVTAYYQNTPVMGRLLAEWNTKDSGVLLLLPLWHPVLAAEQIATLACIAQGNFIVQCGLGGGDYQFKGMGVNIKYRTSSLEQSLECMRALWAGETVSLDGRWKFDSAKIFPLPPSTIQVWIAATAPLAIERVARIGDGWLADPSMTLAQADKAMDVYQTALAKHGKTLPARVALRRDVYVADSAEEAKMTKEEVIRDGYRGFDPEALVIDTAEGVASTLHAFGGLGYTDIIVRDLHKDHKLALRSIERLAKVRTLLA